MKRSEIAMIVLIASLSMLLTFTLAQSLLGDKVKRKASVEQATKISKDLEKPAKRVFNKDAINPTVEVCVESDATSEDSAQDTSNCQGSTAAPETTSTPEADASSTSSGSTTQSTTQPRSTTNTNN